jgi:hypothetical protein
MLKPREAAYRMHNCASSEYPGACPREIYYKVAVNEIFKKIFNKI